ncbi:hypothetical protein O181_014346 [Austropuccinia psidii MF-1]|uniref:Uncharacterized protein n=1 Tax=Austropuccinia psidii MF-1 TaxID=1389203 RepID=A0A9Q3BXY7_9BASI|nr:hypothetical protein [Austropuccinia psidii MF-1]
MGDSIRENSEDDQDAIEEFLVEYQEETQLEAGLPQDTSNKNLCKHTQNSQTFLVTPTKGMTYIHGKATNINFFVDNSQHSLIIHSGEHCFIMEKKYLEKNFPNLENQILPTKANNSKSA